MIVVNAIPYCVPGIELRGLHSLYCYIKKKNKKNFCPRCFNPHFTNETKELSNTEVPTDSK